jgi:hypothetical protein
VESALRLVFGHVAQEPINAVVRSELAELFELQDRRRREFVPDPSEKTVSGAFGISVERTARP